MGIDTGGSRIVAVVTGDAALVDELRGDLEPQHVVHLVPATQTNGALDDVVPAFVIVDLDDDHLDAASIAAMRAASTVPIIAWSSFADPYTLVEVLAAGADSYVDKADGTAAIARTLGALPSDAVDACRPTAAALAEVCAELRSLRARNGRSPLERARAESLAERAGALVVSQWRDAIASD